MKNWAPLIAWLVVMAILIAVLGYFGPRVYDCSKKPCEVIQK